MKLPSETYPSTHPSHRAGEPVFTVDLEPGDREYTLTVLFDRLPEGRPTLASTLLRDGAVHEVDPETLASVAAAPRC